MEAIARQKYVRVSHKKLRRIAEHLKGKTVNDVESILKFYPSRSSIPLRKAVHSAASNLKDKAGPDAPLPENLIVSNIRIDQGPTFKRIKRRAMGRADLMRRRTSHITVIVRGE